MRLKNLEINGFKSFAKKTNLDFVHPVVSIVGPNGSGKSNVVEAFRFVLGEQSMKSMRGRAGADLIFKGSKNLPRGTRAIVTAYFDNGDKVFKMTNEIGEDVNLNFDTITIAREVYADGLNKYLLNGSEVRLKDINNLLASVHIGASGHHIISQGEADRILNASSKDRREMIEEALGLKVYQYKIKDSERKLERTEENMKEVTMLRRENAPHLNFLKKQVEKLEKMKELKSELVVLYSEYLKKENIFLETEKNKLKKEKHEVLSELNLLNEKIQDASDGQNTSENKKLLELKSEEDKLAEIRRVKNELERKLGRIEGMIEIEEHRSMKVDRSTSMTVSRDEFEYFIKEVNEYLEEAIYMDVLENIAPMLERVRDIVNRFAKKFEEEKFENSNSQIENLKNTQVDIMEEMARFEDSEKVLIHKIDILKKEINEEAVLLRDKEREKFTLKVRHQELSSALNILNIKLENLARREEGFQNEIKEGSALLGMEIFNYREYIFEGEINVAEQDELHRKIERIKIKLEDAGLGSAGEIIKEYNDVVERDQFLLREMEDLQKSIESIKILITDLKEKIDLEFKDGIKKINKEFQEFFTLMFGGGHASLAVIVFNKKKKIDKFHENESEEEMEERLAIGEELTLEEGIEINVSLPHKKVKELHALSGGERSLTSIALLFAMSQVNPPPFLVLDETDAALDEANSRKYGDMLERLSKHSQLIVVTHNRETMSRAGVLYGVTVGADGASKLLSVRFDEAAAIAK